MHYLFIVKATKYFEAGIKENQDFYEKKMKYHNCLTEANVLLEAGVLQPSSTGIRLLYLPNSEQPEIQVGPFLIESSIIAEYMLIDVDTEKEALDWALQMPVPNNRMQYVIELRRLEETNGFSQKNRDPLETDLKDLLSILKKTI